MKRTTSQHTSNRAATGIEYSRTESQGWMDGKGCRDSMVVRKLRVYRNARLAGWIALKWAHAGVVNTRRWANGRVVPTDDGGGDCAAIVVRFSDVRVAAG